MRKPNHFNYQRILKKNLIAYQKQKKHGKKKPKKKFRSRIQKLPKKRQKLKKNKKIY